MSRPRVRTAGSTRSPVRGACWRTIPRGSTSNPSTATTSGRTPSPTWTSTTIGCGRTSVTPRRTTAATAGWTTSWSTASCSACGKGWCPTSTCTTPPRGAPPYRCPRRPSTAAARWRSPTSPAGSGRSPVPAWTPSGRRCWSERRETRCSGQQLRQLQPPLLEGLVLGLQTSQLLGELLQAHIVRLIMGRHALMESLHLRRQPIHAPLGGGQFLPGGMGLRPGDGRRAHTGPCPRGGAPARSCGPVGGRCPAGPGRARGPRALPVAAQLEVLLRPARHVTHRAVQYRVLGIGDPLEQIPVVGDHDQG